MGVWAAQLVLFALLGVAGYALPAHADEAPAVTLAWDANPPEEQVVGYLVYWGRVSRTAPEWAGYEHEVDVGDVTEATVEVGPEPGLRCFAAAAYNGLGLRSDYSDEISARVPSAPAVRLT